MTSEVAKQAAAPSQSIADRVRAREARRERVRQKAQAARSRRSSPESPAKAEPVSAAADKTAQSE
jgi:hypothetical protein